MIKLIAFDIDNTLAKIQMPIDSAICKELRKFENNNIQIVLSSGKPCSYVNGLVRMIGLKNPISVGENGGVIHFGIDFPPQKYIIQNPNTNSLNKIVRLKKLIIENIKESIWLQPNLLGLTVFFYDDSTKNKITTIINSEIFEDDNLIVHKHIDCFDITPKNYNKGTSLQKIQDELGINSEHSVSVGDGTNDVPMFESCRYSISLNSDLKATFKAKNIHEAISKIKGLI